MTKLIRQKLILSKLPLSGCFKNENHFQLFPAAPPYDTVPFIKADHLNIIEISIDSSAIQNRQIRGEKKEPEFIVIAKEVEKKEQEIISLLSTLTHYEFFTYDGAQSWYIPYRDGEFASHSEWGQRDYISSETRNPREDQNNFSQLKINEITYEVPHKYYKQYARRLSTEPIHFPSSLNLLINKYWSLDPKLKTIFLNACKFFNMGLKLRDELNHSLSFASFITAIETLSEQEFKKENKKIVFACPDCKTLKESAYKCKKCDSPIWGIAEKFRQFIKKYGSSDEETRKYANKIYGKRSKILHSGKILDTELIDRVEIEHLMILIRICIVNYLINIEST